MHSLQRCRGGIFRPSSSCEKRELKIAEPITSRQKEACLHILHPFQPDSPSSPPALRHQRSPPLSPPTSHSFCPRLKNLPSTQNGQKKGGGAGARVEYRIGEKGGVGQKKVSQPQFSIVPPSCIYPPPLLGKVPPPPVLAVPGRLQQSERVGARAGGRGTRTVGMEGMNEGSPVN